MANRHDVIIWDADVYGTPKSFEQAINMCSTLLEKSIATVSSKLKLFAQDVCNEIAKSAHEDLQKTYANFCEGIETCDTAGLDLELTDYAWEDELITLVNIAMIHGLVVVDTEMAMVFIPPNKILPSEAKTRWSSLKQELKQKNNFPKTLKHFEKWFDKLLLPVLEKYGFSEKSTLNTEHAYFLKNSFVSISVQYQYQLIRDQFYIALRVEIFFQEAYDIYQKFNFHKHSTPSIVAVSFSNIAKENNLSLHMGSYQNAVELIMFLEKKILSVVVSIDSIVKLDDFMNSSQFTNGFHKFYYMPHCLTVARLANNPNFEKLAVELGTYGAHTGRTWGAHAPHQITEWPKLVQYLREDINPDTFWQQYALLKEKEKHLEENRIQHLIKQFQLAPITQLIPISDQWYIPETHLLWQRCCMGEHWQDGRVTGNARLLNWDEVQNILEETKSNGWRLPSLEELHTLTFINSIGYITKDGFDFYEQKTTGFRRHWISGLEDIRIVSVDNHENITINEASIKNIKELDTNLKGYLRLVKSGLGEHR